ncbi:MAG: hypothetical protein UW18_C0018G0005 [Microgenomates group bacterium GW2011_GWF1_44_10]|nr:MAG: hypothetical protein UW18_C0018G0005 [Microgenomates group bacterium GW2011_GWF1_44_10]
MTQLISLDQHDIAEVRRIASLRVEYCQQVQAGYSPYFAGDRLEHEINSFGAEVAFCRMTRATPDMNPRHFATYDAIVNGRRVDVKHSLRMDARLQAKAIKEWRTKPDYFVLMVGRLPVYLFCGYMRADDLLRPGRIDASTRQRTAVYSARQDELYQEMY